MSGFFGLTLNYRKYLHSHIFDLIYHGNGGFNWNDVYNMPIWARRFYTNKIIESVSKECDIEKPGNGILIALKIDKVAGLSKQIKKIRENLKTEQL